MRKSLRAMIRTAQGVDLGGETKDERYVDFVNYVHLGRALSLEEANPVIVLPVPQRVRTVAEIVAELNMKKDEGVPAPHKVMLYGGSGKAANRILD